MTVTPEKPAMEREQEDWDVLRHARWYVGAYRPLTRTMAEEQTELLTKIDAAMSQASPPPGGIAAYLRRRAGQEPSEGLRERQGIDQRAIEYGQALLKSCADEIERSERRVVMPICEHINGYVETYEFRGEGGDYTPNEKERELIEDAIGGFIADYVEAPPPLDDEVERLRELEALISEQSIERLAQDIAIACVDCRPEIREARHRAMVRLGERLRKPLKNDRIAALSSCRIGGADA